LREAQSKIFWQMRIFRTSGHSFFGQDFFAKTAAILFLGRLFDIKMISKKGVMM